jgi:hypothetical protein
VETYRTRREEREWERGCVRRCCPSRCRWPLPFRARWLVSFVFFRSFFSAGLEEMAVSASFLEVLVSGLSVKLVGLLSVLFLAVKLSNSS